MALVKLSGLFETTTLDVTNELFVCRNKINKLV